MFMVSCGNLFVYSDSFLSSLSFFPQTVRIDRQSALGQKGVEACTDWAAARSRNGLAWLIIQLPRWTRELDFPLDRHWWMNLTMLSTWVWTLASARVRDQDRSSIHNECSLNLMLITGLGPSREKGMDRVDLTMHRFAKPKGCPIYYDLNPRDSSSSSLRMLYCLLRALEAGADF